VVPRAEEEHKLYEARWDHQDVLYFGHKRFVDAYSGVSPRPGRGDGRRRKEFGAELHIPYVFSTIHTIAPRTLSNRPRMLFLPRDKVGETNVENVTVVCDAQQQKANYELKLQTTNLGGLKHGLGVQKTYWRRRSADTFVLAEGADGVWVRRPVTKPGVGRPVLRRRRHPRLLLGPVRGLDGDGAQGAASLVAGLQLRARQDRLEAVGPYPGS
jgi:hypothetical protein